MIEWLKERFLRFELEREQWHFHCHQASLLPESQLRYVADGDDPNLQFAKACRYELARRHLRSYKLRFFQKKQAPSFYDNDQWL